MSAPALRASNVAAAFRVPGRRRVLGWAVALALEALLVLALLTLDRGKRVDMAEPPRTVSFDLSPDVSPEPPAPQQAPAETRTTEAKVAPAPTADRVSPSPTPTPPAPVPPLPPPPSPLVELPRGSMPSVDLRTLPAGPPSPSKPRRAAGPPADAGDRDTPVVGTAPNGERLYAASWYREPYDDELRGYLSTADGPGWALIACRTVPDYRVDDCVALDEYPAGSRMARAVLAAAWQFRVRPPQLGGQLKVGEWVRIRIDYTRARAG